VQVQARQLKPPTLMYKRELVPEPDKARPWLC
jgi:hypothetical protein